MQCGTGKVALGGGAMPSGTANTAVLAGSFPAFTENGLTGWEFKYQQRPRRRDGHPLGDLRQRRLTPFLLEEHQRPRPNQPGAFVRPLPNDASIGPLAPV